MVFFSKQKLLLSLKHNLVGGIAVSNFGQCLTDTFSVSSPDGSNPPTICGNNNGEHSEFK